MGFDEERPIDRTPDGSESEAGGSFEPGGSREHDIFIDEDNGLNKTRGEGEIFEGRPIEHCLIDAENNKEDASNGKDNGSDPYGDGNNRREMGFLEIIYGVIVEPKGTFRYLGTARTLFPAFVFLVILTLFNVFTGAGEMRQIPEVANIPVDFSSFLGPISVLAVFLALLGWFMEVAAISLFSQLLGGAGNGRGLLSAYVFASLPMLLSSILDFGIKALGFGGFLAGLASLAGLIWTLVLQVLAVREIEQLSLGRALLAYCALPLIILVMVIILVVYLVVALGPVIEQFSTFPLR